MSFHFDEIIKSRNVISTLVLLLCGTNAQETTVTAEQEKVPPFQCPVECPQGLYSPVCSRGISYANLCILKRQICQGNAASEIYNDVEECPKYEKDDDANGASIEAIDKNGVIFRAFTDFQRPPNPNEITLKSSSSLGSRRKGQINKASRWRAQQRHEKEEDATRTICGRLSDCSIHKIGNPVCILGIQLSSLCTVQRLVCESYLPIVAMLLIESCDN